MTCVLAPLAEEFFFRGFLFRVLHERINAVIAVLVTGIAFGLVHLPERRLDRHDRPQPVRNGTLRAVHPHVVFGSVHHVARIPQLDLVRLHEGAALVGIPAVDPCKRHDDACHRPVGLARAGLVAVIAALLLPAGALAQDPVPTPTPTPTPVPTPVPVAGTLKLQAQKVHRDGERKVALTRTAWRVRGVLTPYVAGQRSWSASSATAARSTSRSSSCSRSAAARPASSARRSPASARGGWPSRPSTSPRRRWTRCAARRCVST